MVAVKFFKTREETRELLYSTDEGQTWSTHEFYHDDLRMFGLITEPGENTTVFTMFGSTKGNLQWLIIKADLRPVFR